MSVALHVVEHGEGRPVLAVHGWGPDHRLMTGCLEPVFAGRPGFRRLYPDLPGMGKTPAPESVTCSDDILAALLDVVDDEIGDEPFLVVGQSYGGLLARAIVRARQAQVLGLALICPVGPELVREKRTRPADQVLYSEPDVLAALPANQRKLFHDNHVVHSADVLRRFQDEVGCGLAVADQAALDRIYPNWALAIEPESGPAFDRPSLIVVGRQDSSVGYADQYDLLDHYPRASFLVLDRAGHALQYEQPAVFTAAVSEWLDRVEEAA